MYPPFENSATRIAITFILLIIISDTTYLFVKKEADCEEIFELKVDQTNYIKQVDIKRCVEVVDNYNGVKITKISCPLKGSLISDDIFTSG